MRSLEEVGARRWFNNNPAHARKNCGVFLLPKDGISSEIDEFCKTTGVTREELRRLGRQACAIGYNEQPSKRDFILGGNINVQLWRSVPDRWDAVDGTVVTTTEDEAHRYQVTLGTILENMACAVDSALVCAIQLNAGRTRIDQLYLEAIADLTPLARLMRQIVTLHWADVGQQTRERARDTFHDAYTKFMNAAYVESIKGPGKIGDLIPVAKVLEQGLRDLAQLSFTWVQATRCCDDILMMRRNVNTRPTNNIDVVLGEKQTVQQFIDEWFSAKIKNCEAGETCTRHKRCVLRQQSIRMVVDRLPPVLMLIFGEPVDYNMNVRQRAFSKLTVQAEHTDGVKSKTYRPVGCVMYTPGHFRTMWSYNRTGADTSVIQKFDGKGNGKAERVKGWYYEYSNSRKPSDTFAAAVIFYRQFSKEEDMKNSVVIED